MELKVDLKKDGELLFVDLQGDLDINSNKVVKQVVSINIKNLKKKLIPFKE